MMGGGAESAPLFLFVKTIEKEIILRTVLIFFFWVVVVKIGPYYGHFSRIYLSICNGHIKPPAIITKLNYVKNGPIFKTTTQKKSTQCIILLLFLLFSQIKIGGTLSAPPPPPIITRSFKHAIIIKVNLNNEK